MKKPLIINASAKRKINMNVFDLPARNFIGSAFRHNNYEMVAKPVKREQPFSEIIGFHKNFNRRRKLIIYSNKIRGRRKVPV
jgi:hypothetical protein